MIVRGESTGQNAQAGMRVKVSRGSVNTAKVVDSWFILDIEQVIREG